MQLSPPRRFPVCSSLSNFGSEFPNAAVLFSVHIWKAWLKYIYCYYLRFEEMHNNFLISFKKYLMTTFVLENESQFLSIESIVAKLTQSCKRPFFYPTVKLFLYLLQTLKLLTFSTTTFCSLVVLNKPFFMCQIVWLFFLSTHWLKTEHVIQKLLNQCSCVYLLDTQ